MLRLDNIDHLIIRNLYENYHTLLLDIHNCLLSLNYFPKDLKFGELVVHFLKLDKPPDEMVFLQDDFATPNVQKVFWKMAHHSLRVSLDNHHNMEGKSTVYNNESFTRIILSNRTEYSKGCYIFLIFFLDFQNAFDRLPWIATMQELQYLDLEIPHINTVRSFLSQRDAYPNWLSDDVYWFHRECPQGSCFGPFL